MNRILKATIGAGAALALFAGAVFASPPSFSGGAEVVSGGNPGNAVELVSDLTDPFSVVSFALPADTTWADLDVLSADYNVTDDDCGGGSPRYQIRVDTNNDGVSDGSVRVSFGPSPNFTDCATGWQTTGNVIGNEDAGRYDYSVFGGSPFTTYSNAPAIVQNGEVLSVAIVVDASWSADATGGDSEQTILVDNVLINSDLHTFDESVINDPTTQDACKNGGWEDFGFRNQGQCIRFVNTGQDSR